MASRKPELSLSVQHAVRHEASPHRPQVLRWLRAAQEGAATVSVRFVDVEEGRALNREYRHKDYATNVLSFVYDSGPMVGSALPMVGSALPMVVGDLVICVPVVLREAHEQGKAVAAHFAHLIVHGMLHLQGYDHETGAREARRMEAREREILAGLGFPDPY
ncbi:rRNA maturation RNase YbeY [Sulfurisoma sediminicola]|uniref:Endoribonuclease YbeY n=1 Tax=Sulfurisoma sediminicola TaxID=1381557 RepID=A0A497XKI4_9PROT|nr:rRNA maturation RNase YbeY [Sulfurisoma sediminicola]RLJ67890.1 putative rRNA maturation factor [Sulfurisoma sediminicola]